MIANVAAHSGEASAHGDLGLLYSENGFHQEAIACFEHAESLDSGNLVWPFRRAMAMRQIGETGEATALLAELAMRAEAFPAIYFELGVARAGDGDLEGAAVAFEKAAAQSPNRPEPLVALADIFNRQSRFEKARTVSEKALKLDPQYVVAHYQLGLALRGAGDRDAAKRELQLGLGAETRSLPDPLSERSIELGISRIGRLGRAVRLCDRGDLAGSEAILRKLAVDYPDDVAVLNNLAAVLIDSKRHEDAMKILKEVVASDDRLFGPFINMSFCSIQLHQYADAIVYAREAVARGSHVSQCHIALGDALSVAKDIDGALASYQRAHELAPANAQVLVAMGRLCGKVNRFDESIRYLQDAVALQPDLFVAHVNLCAVALQHGAIDTAVRAFARADALGPDDPQTAALRQRLQMVQRQ
ncbi:MAG: tetratricopeptide repeat protein [Phycisphaerales bacterium]|nr:tetratricopeptide repeat protein [Phycisphaerales bacterium]MCB9855949.1 tetratricopeptide repeat protein [Phycisphaerales bacterium]MCB9864070.1 tetratricopeptide repeat protein [Phycisphaerales bacterium]